MEEGRGGEEEGMEQEIFFCPAAISKLTSMNKNKQAQLFNYQTFVVVVQHVFKLNTDALNSKFQYI